jgi:hypothetical protein
VPVDLLADPVSQEVGVDADWMAHVAARAPGLVDVACGILS